MPPTPGPYGTFVRTKRLEAGLSLRALAEKMGVSHVYIGEVERGARGPFAADKVTLLLAALPNVSREDLERHTSIEKGVQLRLADAPPRYQDLGLALARRIEKRDLSQKELTDLWRLLGGKERDE